MASEFKYLESIDLSNQVNKGFACEQSTDDHISIATDVGVYILQLCIQSDSTIPSISFKKYYVPAFNYFLGTHLGIDVNSFGTDLSQADMYELALLTDVSPNFSLYAEVEPKVVSCKWSPCWIDNTRCILGVLNNGGSLNIYARSFTYGICENYVSICNLTEHIVEYYKSTWTNVNKSSYDIYLELKKRIRIKPTGFIWSNIIKKEDRTYCLLIISHVNGDVTFWILNISNTKSSKEIHVKCIRKISTDHTNITSLHLHHTNARGLLLIGDLQGRVTGVPLLHIDVDKIRYGKSISLWNEEDNVKVEFMNVMVIEKYLYFVVVRADCLYIFLTNKNGKLIDSSTFHVGNLNITGLEKLDDNILLVLTLTGAMKEIKLSCNKGKVEVEWRHVYINVNWSMKRAHGFIFTRNKVLLGLLTYPGRVKDRKDEKDLINFLVFANLSKDPIQILMDNPTNSIYNYWDCFETIRVLGIVRKLLPNNSLVNVDSYDNFNFVKLKTHLHLLKIYEVIYEQLEVIEDEYNLKSFDNLLCIVNIKLAIYRMQHLLDLNSKKKINKFQLQNLFVLHNFLQQIVLDDVMIKIQLGENTLDEILDVMIRAAQLTYPKMPKCSICEDRIMSSFCQPAHFKSYCAISMMPLDIYTSYKCPFCKCRVHTELEKEMNVLYCPYCDIPLNFQQFDNCNSDVLTVDGVKDLVVT